ncbi:class D beta-lactamase, partial [Mesorhizobium sp. M8A.F.Ca.ET.213.01.1.1]
MRQIDRFPFVFALVLYLLAWFLGLPVRARSAPLREVECALVLPGSRYETI